MVSKIWGKVGKTRKKGGKLKKRGKGEGGEKRKGGREGKEKKGGERKEKEKKGMKRGKLRELPSILYSRFLRSGPPSPFSSSEKEFQGMRPKTVTFLNT